MAREQMVTRKLDWLRRRASQQDSEINRLQGLLKAQQRQFQAEVEALVKRHGEELQACGDQVRALEQGYVRDLKVKARIQEIAPGLKKEQAMLIQYLTVKAEAKDWHAVADAAMDLREVEAALGAVERLL